MAICRFCKADRPDSHLVHYGARHSACPACLVAHKGAAGVAELTNWKIVAHPELVACFFDAHGMAGLERFSSVELDAMPARHILRAGYLDSVAALILRKQAAETAAIANPIIAKEHP